MWELSAFSQLFLYGKCHVKPSHNPPGDMADAEGGTGGGGSCCLSNDSLTTCLVVFGISLLGSELLEIPLFTMIAPKYPFLCHFDGS